MSTTRLPLTKRCPVCGYRFETDLESCPLDGATLPRERPGVDRLGPYVLLERIGTGGMGAVYRALNEKVGRSVAVKTLHRSFLTDQTTVKRFFHEARAVNTIRHPNVVEVYDLASQGEDHFMVMEFLRGRDLQPVITEHQATGMPVDRVAKILEQICGALHAAHSRDIVHRDLKPANIFLVRRHDTEDFVKLLDFGLAKLGAAASGGKLTAEGITLGTPEYMAPEQARGGKVDRRADLYAVGCIAYEMLTGRLPVVGEGPVDIMIKQITEVPAPLRTLRPDLPEALEAAIARCLAKNADERPATALELAQELAAAVGRPFDATGAFESWREWSASEHTTTLRSVLAARADTGQLTAGTMSLQRSRLGPRARRALLVATLGTLAAGLFLTLRPLVSRPPAPVVAEAPRLVRLLVQSQPPGATVFDGEVQIGTTPMPLLAPAGSTRRIRVVHAGFAPAERQVRLADDGTIALALEPIPPPKAERPAGRRARDGRAKRAQAGGAAKTTADLGARTLNPF